MSNQLTKDELRLTVEFARDLSTRTVPEILAKWPEPDRLRINDISRRTRRPTFEALLKNHNPLYYLADKVFFSNPEAKGNEAYLYAPYHRDLICKDLVNYYLNGGRSGHILLAPRDTFKSTFSQGVLPLWVSLREKHVNNKDARIAMIHHKEVMAKANSLRLKLKAKKSEWLKAFWPEFALPKRDMGTKTEWSWGFVGGDVTAETSITAIGMTGSLTGFHYDAIIFDDPVTEDHINSKVIRDDTVLRYDSIMFTLDTLNGRLFHTGTRYHVNDLWSKLMKSKHDVTNADLFSTTILRAKDPEGNLIFPTRLSEAFLDRRRNEIKSRNNGSDLLWWLQYFNEPRSETQVAADVSWIQFRSHEEVAVNSWRCILVDPAWKGTENQGKGDYASIQAWAFERRGSLVLMTLLDGVHSNMLTDSDGKDAIFKLMKAYGIVDVAPEERGGFSFRQSLKNDAATRGVFINVITLKSMQVNKTQRMATFVGEAQKGRVFVANECNPELRAAFLGQFEDFPQLDVNDALDCAAYTCDPAITEAYAPAFNTLATTPYWAADEFAYEDEAPMTRWSGF